MKDETKTALGVAYLTVIIIASYSLMKWIANTLLEVHSFKIFFACYSLWIVVTAGILFVLYKLNKKQNQSFSTIFKDYAIRKTSGGLVIIYGILDLAGSLPSQISFVLSIQEPIQIGVSKSVFMNGIVSDAIRFVFNVVLILVGIYLLKYREKIKGIDELNI